MKIDKLAELGLEGEFRDIPVPPEFGEKTPAKIFQDVQGLMFREFAFARGKFVWEDDAWRHDFAYRAQYGVMLLSLLQ